MYCILKYSHNGKAAEVRRTDTATPIAIIKSTRLSTSPGQSLSGLEAESIAAFMADMRRESH